jgi:hypothetical protein
LATKTAKQISAPAKPKPAAPVGNAKTVQRKAGTETVIAAGVQRKESTGNWLFQKPQRAVHAQNLVQPKIKIHPSNDSFEKEADRVADSVVSAPSPATASISKISSGLQKKSYGGSIKGLKQFPVQRKISSASRSISIQRKQSNSNNSSLRESDSSPPSSQTATHPLQSVLSGQSTRGSPLPTGTRSFMENRIGADFSNVRIHTGQESNAASTSIGARAFTHGPNIHFSSGEYDPHSSKGQHLLAHELTHTVQQGASPAAIQRKSDHSSSSVPSENIYRGPPVQAKAEAGVIQCAIYDNALARIDELLTDLPALTDGLDGAKRWLMGKLRRFASFIPGYTAVGVVLGFDPITGDHVDRNGRNFIEAALDIIPFGGLLKQKLEELGALERAATWIDGQLETLSNIITNVRDEFTTAWNRLELLDVVRGSLHILENFGRIFERAINNLITFAERAARELLDIVKKFLLTQLVNFIKNHTNAYELLKVILGKDPITDEVVTRNGTNILNALLELGGEQGREQRRQMQDTGTFQKAADWIDRGIAVFGDLYQTIRDNFGLIWDAVSIQSLMDPVGTFNRIYETFAAPVRRVLDFVEEALRAILALIKEVLMQRLSAWARTVRGYQLVTVLIGKDPFTNQVVPRTIPNVIRGFMSLMEGGEEQYRQMEESGAIARTTQRINAAVARLNMTPASIVQLFIDLWNSFSFNDLAHPIDAFQRIIEKFGEPIGRLIAFVVEIVKIVVHVILELMNFPFDLINNIVTRAMQAFERIKRDPIGFLKNLLRAIKQGFSQFFNNIVTHLINGVVGWLMSELRDANVPQPTDFSLRGIISWVLQVLGISMEAIWQKLAAHPRIGPERVARIRGMIDRLEGIWTFIRDVQQRGVAAIWDKIQEQLTNLWNTVLDAIKNWIMDRIISQVTARLLSMLDPTGIMAVINSAIAIYRAIQSFIRYLRQMLEVVNSFVNGVADIAEGNVTTAANYLERTMDRAMPIVIGFLANQIGLSGVGRRIAEIIASVRQMVDRALTWLVNRAVDTGFAMFDRLMAMGRSAAGAVLGWLGFRKEFRTQGGEAHTLFFQGSGENAELTMASEPRRYKQHLDQLDAEGKITAAQRPQFNQAKTKLDELNRLKREQRRNRDESADNTQITNLVNDIANLTSTFLSDGLPVSTMPVYHMGTNRAGFSKGVKVEKLTKNGPAGSAPSANNSTWETLNMRRQGGRSFYVRGHLLSNYYHGSGSEWHNLVPMFQNHNTAFETKVESRVKSKYDASGILYFEVVVDYGRAPNPNKTAIVAAEPDPIKKIRLGQLIDAEVDVPTTVTLVVDEYDAATNQRKMNSIIEEVHLADIQNTSYSQYAIQTKLQIGSSGDHYEQEADHIADKVTSGERIVAPVSISRLNGNIAQGKTRSDKETAGNIIVPATNSQSTRGSPLPVKTKAVMENKIGADFSNVRVHTGEDSHKTNTSIGSRAFAQGSNIHFAKGEFDPDTKKGQHLIAHELVHTVQQGASAQKNISPLPDKQSQKANEIIAAATKKNNGPLPETKTKSSAEAIPQHEKLSLKPNENKKITSGGGTKKAIPSAGKPGDKITTSKTDNLLKGGIATAQVDEERPLSSITSYIPTQLGKGFPQVQENTKVINAKQAKSKIDGLPKVPLASGSAYGMPIPKHAKGYKDGKSAGDINGLKGKPGFSAPELPETVIPGERIVTPVKLPSSGSADKDEVDAASADDALENVKLDTEGIPTEMTDAPKIELVDEADPGNMDEALDEQSEQVKETKEEASKDIWLDYGENDVIKKPKKGNITAKKKIKPYTITPRPLSKSLTYPDYFEAKAAGYTNGEPYRRMNAKTETYYGDKEQQEEKMDSEELRCMEQIEEQKQLSKQGQLNAKVTVISQVGQQRQSWYNELNETEKTFYDSSVNLKKGFNDSITEEKNKGDEEIRKKVDEANNESAEKHKKAHEDVEKEKEKKKKESSGFFGWLRSKASALLDALKSFVNWVFDNLRKAVKWIFDKVKKWVKGFLEMIHKAVVGLIKGFGAMLKGFASIALFAFPETRKKVVGAIDGAVDYAVEKTDAAFEAFENFVSDIIDGLADFVDSCLGLIQDLTNFAFDALKFIVNGLLYVLEYLMNIEKMYAMFKKMIDGFMYMWDHPEVVEQKAKEFLQPYIDDVQNQAPAEMRKALGEFNLAVAKHINGILAYLMPNLKHLAANWWGEAKKMIWFLIWPFAKGSPLREDAPKLWRLVPQIWDDFWNGNFSRCVDGCLEWMQALNSVVGSFAGWIVIGSVVVGAIVGAFFGGVGAIPGAGAGLEVGLAIGEGIMMSMIATESAVIMKAVYDLYVTDDDGKVTTPAAQKAAAEAKQENSTGQPESNGPTIRSSGDVKTGRDRIEFAYQRIANSSLALGVMLALILLGAIGGKIAQAIVSGIKKLASIVGDLLPGVTEGLGKLGTVVKESKLGTKLADAAEDFNAGRKSMKTKIDTAKESIGLKKKKTVDTEVGKADDEKAKPGDKAADEPPKKTDAPKKEEPSPEKPMMHEDGKEIVDEAKSSDGKRKLEQTVEGDCLVCSSPCAEIQKKYEIELRRPEAEELRAKLDEIKKSGASAKAKSKMYKEVEQSLADLRKADAKLKFGSPAHKARSWLDHQLKHPDKFPEIKPDFDPAWSKQYDTLFENGKRGGAFENEALSKNGYKKNTKPLWNPETEGKGIIPDSLKGNPEAPVWGDRLDFVEVKAWKEMADLTDSNLDQMIDYLKESSDSTLEIIFTSDHPLTGAPTKLSGPLQARIDAMIAAGYKIKITFYP